jgi:hypothetical protein
VITTVATAQDDVCADILPRAAHEIGLTQDSSDVLDNVFTKYCEENGNTKSSSFNGGVSIPSLPISLTGGSSDKSTQIHNFCSNYSHMYHAQGSHFTYQDTVVTKALDAVVDCYRIQKTSAQVSHKFLTKDTLVISFIPGNQPLTISGISHPSTVTCIGRGIGGPKEFTVSTMYKINHGSYSVTCTRTPKTEQGTTFYDEAGLGVSTGAGPYNIFWPKETNLPLTQATQIQATIDDLKHQLLAAQGELARFHKAMTIGEDGSVSFSSQISAPNDSRGDCSDVTLTPTQRGGPDMNWCPAGTFLIGVDVDDTGGPPQSSPLPARARCCHI